jgi:hypothetical protein
MTRWVEAALLQETIDGTTDDHESNVVQGGTVTVAAKSKGVTRSEFYAAANTIYRPEMVLEVWADEYHGERRVTVEGVTYTIIRTYPTGGGKIELTCQQKGADEDG